MKKTRPPGCPLNRPADIITEKKLPWDDSAEARENINIQK